MFVRLTPGLMVNFFQMMRDMFDNKDITYYTSVDGRPVSQTGTGVVTFEAGNTVKLMLPGGFGIGDCSRKFVPGDLFLYEPGSRITVGRQDATGFEIFKLTEF